MQPTRRDLFRRLVGAGAVLGGAAGASAMPRAAQRKPEPVCPTCGRVFGLWVDFTLKPGQVTGLGTDRLQAPIEDVTVPGKRWPVRCACGWSGTAVFYEA